MHEELKEDEIVNRVGGRFKLATLIQKRWLALKQGARPQVEHRSPDHVAVIIREIMENKIYLDLTGRLRVRGQTEALDIEGETVDLTQPSE